VITSRGPRRRRRGILSAFAAEAGAGDGAAQPRWLEVVPAAGRPTGWLQLVLETYQKLAPARTVGSRRAGRWTGRAGGRVRYRSRGGTTGKPFPSGEVVGVGSRSRGGSTIMPGNRKGAPLAERRSWRGPRGRERARGRVGVSRLVAEGGRENGGPRKWPGSAEQGKHRGLGRKAVSLENLVEARWACRPAGGLHHHLPGRIPAAIRLPEPAGPARNWAGRPVKRARRRSVIRVDRGPCPASVAAGAGKHLGPGITGLAPRAFFAHRHRALRSWTGHHRASLPRAFRNRHRARRSNVTVNARTVYVTVNTPGRGGGHPGRAQSSETQPDAEVFLGGSRCLVTCLGRGPGVSGLGRRGAKQGTWLCGCAGGPRPGREGDAGGGWTWCGPVDAGTPWAPFVRWMAACW